MTEIKRGGGVMTLINMFETTRTRPGHEQIKGVAASTDPHVYEVASTYSPEAA